MTEQEIHNICKVYNIKNYTINPDGSIDVKGDVFLSNKNLDKLPLKFNKVSGVFVCSYNELTSLEGSPKKLGLKLYCSGNPLTTLNGFNLPYDKLVYYLFDKDEMNILIKKHRRNRFIKHIVSDQ
jgi:hypothetical protein